MIAFGQLLAEGRNQLGMTLEQAKELLEKHYEIELSGSMLSRYENGDFAQIEPELYKALIDLYGVDETQAARALDRHLGGGRSEKFVVKAMRSGRRDIASSFLQATSQAA